MLAQQLLGEKRKNGISFKLEDQKDLERFQLVNREGFNSTKFFKACLDLELELSKLGISNPGEFQLINFTRFYLARIQQQKAAQHAATLPNA